MKYYIFGYGSLVEFFRSSFIKVVQLYGYRRIWHVAMDNSKDIPGYRYFVDSSNKRPETQGLMGC